VVYLTPPRGEEVLRRDEVFFRLCGVKEIIGVPHGELATYHYDPVADRYESEASRLARCVSQIGHARLHDKESWDLLLTDKEKARANGALREFNDAPLLAVGIASKQNVTDWGVAHWKQLMPLLHEQFPRHALVFIGAKEDNAAIEEVASRWPGRSLNLGGLLSPRESSAVIRNADLYLGLDSGPMHLAASVGTRCVSISGANRLPGTWFPFGATHEVIYHKTDCFGCNLEACTVEKNKCILSISPSEVVAAAIRAAQQCIALPVLQ
jgi:heptosyltransferase-3